MDISPYHYGKAYAVSLRVFCPRVKRGGRLIETAILKPEGQERLFGTSFFWYLWKKKKGGGGLLPPCEEGREAWGRKSSSLLWRRTGGSLWQTSLHKRSRSCKLCLGVAEEWPSLRREQRRQALPVPTRKRKGQPAISVLHLRKHSEGDIFPRTNPREVGARCGRRSLAPQTRFQEIVLATPDEKYRMSLKSLIFNGWFARDNSPNRTR